MGTSIAAATATAILGIISAASIFALIFYVLLIIAGWKILQKAGEPGWKILIPIYNLYIMYKIVSMQNWFWATLAVSIVASLIIGAQTGADGSVSSLAVLVSVCESIFMLAVNIMYAIRTSKDFGHGGGYAAGLFFLPNIFWLIIGFGKSKYHKSAIKK